MPTSYQIADKLYLVQHEVSKSAPPAKVEVPTNHIVVVDCSGSMYGELPKIREQLKARLPKLLKESDTISLVWFSGRGQFGTLIEGEPVATLADLKDVNSQIDRWIKSIGLTGFKEPLESIPALIQNVQKKAAKGSVFSLFFMSDGCDNVWPRNDILKSVEKAAGGLASATFVEYGYYADRPLLSQMAERAGGTHIFAQDFDTYGPTFEAAMQKKTSGAKRVEVKIPGDTIGGFAFTFAAGELTTFAIDPDVAKVPEDTQSLWYLSPTKVGTDAGTLDLLAKSSTDPRNASSGDVAVGAAYAAVSLFSVRMLPNVVLPLLKSIGDVKHIEKFGGCFGKQKYSEFMDMAKEAVFDKTVRFEKGRDPTKIPPDDAFTVLDLLRELASDDDNRLLLDHKDFKYSRIGRGQLDASEVLTSDDQAAIKALTDEMTKTKDPSKVKELTEKIAAVTAKKEPALKFAAKDAKDDGYGVSNLTFNEERPNVSLLVRKEGSVDITARLAKAAGDVSKVPASFESFIFRNYTIVKDGLTNVKKLPVKLTGGTVRRLREKGFPMSAVLNLSEETLEQAVTRIKKAADEREVSFVVDLESLPVINRNMVKATSAKALFELEYELTKARAAQKVFNTVKKDLFPKTSVGFEQSYGKDAAAWLKEQGFTDYSGFSPKSVQADATDFYLSKELHVSLKGLSSLPSLKDVREKMTKGKLTPSAALMAPFVTEVDAFTASDVYTKAPNRDAIFSTWLDGKQKEATSRVRGYLFDMAQIRFSIIVGQTWPVEFKSLDDQTLKITVDGQDIEGKLELKEVEVKI